MTDRDDHSRARGHRVRRVLLAVGILVAVLVGGIVWWVDQGRHYFIPKNFAPVEEGLVYRSGRIHRGLIEDTLRDHGIEVIVDLAAAEANHPDVIAETEAARKLGIRKVDLVGLDGYGTGDLQDYALAVRELVNARKAGTPILVHCAGGSERTGGVFVFDRLLFQGWDGARAWEEYLSYRMKPPERPNFPDYVNANLDELVTRLQRLGVDVQMPDPKPHFGPAQED